MGVADVIMMTQTDPRFIPWHQLTHAVWRNTVRQMILSTLFAIALAIRSLRDQIDVKFAMSPR